MTINKKVKRKKILVHICCSACLSCVEKVINLKDFEIVGFFYNPQVHGKAEYLRRLKDVKWFCNEKEINLIVPEYNIQDFFSTMMPFQDKNSIKFINDKKRWRIKRCQICHALVLGRTANEAQKRKIKYFTTSMLITPYKNHHEIWNRGLELEREYKLVFYYKDFRKGYWSGRNYARSHNMYTPTYCGCIYSSEEGILE